MATYLHYLKYKIIDIIIIVIIITGVMIYVFINNRYIYISIYITCLK